MKTTPILLTLLLLAGTTVFARDNVILTLGGGERIAYDRADIVDMEVLQPPARPEVAVDARIPIGHHVSLHVTNGYQEPPPPPYQIVILHLRDGRALRYEAYEIQTVHIEEPPPPPPVVVVTVPRPRVGLEIVIGERDHWDHGQDHWYHDHWERWDRGRWVICNDHRGHDRDWDRDHDRRGRDHDWDRDHDRDRHDDHHVGPRPDDHHDAHPGPRPDDHHDAKPGPRPDNHHDTKPGPRPTPPHNDKPKPDKNDDEAKNPNAGHELRKH